MTSTQLTPEQMNALMHRMVFDMQEKGDISLLNELFHPGFINHTAMGDLPNNIDGVPAVFNYLHSSFKDIKMEIIQCVAQGNVIATNKVLRGRQVGDFAGSPASGKMAELPIMDFVTIEDGKIKEHWARTGAITVIE